VLLDAATGGVWLGDLGAANARDAVAAGAASLAPGALPSSAPPSVVASRSRLGADDATAAAAAPELHAAPAPAASPFAAAAARAAARPPAPAPTPRPAAAARLVSYHTFAGTPASMAPEIVAAEGYGPACDIYSLGTLILELAGASPYAGLPPTVLYMAKLHAAPPELDPGCGWSRAAAELAAACLARDPAARPTAADVLASPWLAGVTEKVAADAVKAMLADALAPPSPPPPALSAGRRASGALLTAFLAKGASGGSGGRGSVATSRSASPPAGVAAGLVPPPLPHDPGGSEWALQVLESASWGDGTVAHPPSADGVARAARLAALLADAQAVAIVAPECRASVGLRRYGYALGVALVRVPLLCADPFERASTRGAPPPGHVVLPDDGRAWAGPIFFYVGHRHAVEPAARGEKAAARAAAGPAASVHVARTPRGAARMALYLRDGGMVSRETGLPPLADGRNGFISTAPGRGGDWAFRALIDRLMAPCAMLTAAVHGRDVDVGALLAGRVPPPGAWRGVLHEVALAARGGAAAGAPDGAAAAGAPDAAAPLQPPASPFLGGGGNG